MRLTRLCALIVTGLTTTACFPVFAVRAGAGMNSADKGVHATFDSDIGMLGGKAGLLTVLRTSYYEGSHDILTFGPTIGMPVGPGAPAMVTVGAEAGPMVNSNEHGGSYYGVNAGLKVFSFWKEHGEPAWYPLQLAIQGQYGQRRGTTNWNGSRVGGQIMISYGFP